MLLMKLDHLASLSLIEEIKIGMMITVDNNSKKREH